MSDHDEAVALVDEMPLPKKIVLLYGDGDWQTNAIEGTSIKALEFHDGPNGLRKPIREKVPRGLFVAPSEKTTCFPSPCLLACSWDPEVTKQIGEAIAKECLNHGTDLVLAPGVCIKRNPRCGRNFEYYSEDPLLSGLLGAGYVNGVQSLGVGTSLKHFAANSQEYRRLTSDSIVDERTLREIYLKAFEIVVKQANPWTVMCSYNKINGVYSANNDWLLKKVLREEWGYKGCVVSDWWAVSSYSDCHNHGLDLEMPCHAKRKKRLLEAVKNGKLDPKEAALCASHVATLNDRLAERKPSAVFSEEESYKAALKGAEESMVLAKNAGVLPLNDYSDACLIGALAETPRYQGRGSSEIEPLKLVSIFDALRHGGEPLPYAPGYSLPGEKEQSGLVEGAVSLANAHKKTILVLGLPSVRESEGYDRHDIRLPQNQLDLVSALAAASSELIVVLCLGAPVELPFLSEIKALLIAYLGGEGLGQAVDDILRGKVNPSGKLAETWPLSYEDVPSSGYYLAPGEKALYKEGVYVGYRYYLTANKPVLFPFGYGLSYASFAYEKAELSMSGANANAIVDLMVTLSNSGLRAGKEVVQVYVSLPNSKTYAPRRELRSFSKVSLEPGERKTITLSLPIRDWAHYDSKKGAWLVEEGTYLVEIGASSEDIRLRAELPVKSGYSGRDLRGSLPDFYAVPQNGFAIPDAEFSALLGHPLPQAADLRKRPFTYDSAIEDLGDYHFGKLLRKVVTKYMSIPERDALGNADTISTAMESPIRAVGNLTKNDHLVECVLDLANGKPLKAFRDLFIGKRKDS